MMLRYVTGLRVQGPLPLLRKAVLGKPLSRGWTKGSSRGLASVAVEGIPKEPTELDRITTLPNGLRVASKALPGSFSGVGVYVEAGSRFEDAHTRGVSHIMDRLAFKSTSRHTADEMLERVEALGGNIQCASSRESMMYQAATFNRAVPETVALLAETIRDPQVTEAEVAEQLETARYEIAEIWNKPDLILPELLHSAAYRDNTLGNPLLCPAERLAAIDRAAVVRYREQMYHPERVVLAFAGVAHEEAVALAERYFGDMKGSSMMEQIMPEESLSSSSSSPSQASHDHASSASSSTSSFSSSSSSSSSASSQQSQHQQQQQQQQQRPKLFSKIPFLRNMTLPRSATVLTGPQPLPPLEPVTNAPAHFTGGFLALPPVTATPGEVRHTHIHVAFEGLPVGSDDIYALATLQTLLGGGGSFSAGGPGKGMYSRLYTNVLNQFGWVESCVAFNHSYLDSGLFGIAASCVPTHASTMLDVVCEQLRQLTLSRGAASLKPDEVERAKKQLRSSLLMNLESRMVELEDLGRSVQMHGRKIPVRDMCRRIEALTVDDLRRVASRVVGGAVENPGRGSGAPAVVVYEPQHFGLATRPMSWDQIQDRIFAHGLGRGG